MDKRLLLFLIISFIILQLTMMTIKTPPPVPQDAGTGTSAPLQTPAALAPSSIGQAQPTTGTLAIPAPTTYAQGPLIPIKTDYYDIAIASNGAIPVRWDIVDPRYMTLSYADGASTASLPEHLIDPRLSEAGKVQGMLSIILQESNSRFYNEFNLMPFEHTALDAAGLEHRFTSPPNANGVQMTKTYRFQRDSYLVDLSIELSNQGTANIQFGGGERGLGLSIGPGLGPPMDPNSGISSFAKTDVIVKAGEDFLYEGFKKAGQQSETITTDNTRTLSALDWAGIEGMYFMGVAIPAGQTRLTTADAMLDPNLPDALAEAEVAANPERSRQDAFKQIESELHYYPTIEAYCDPFTLAAGEKAEFQYTLYMGPKQQERLKEAGNDLSRALFHNSWSWFRVLCLWLMWLLFKFHGWVGNWGVAIIMLTVFVKLIALPMVHKGMKSQAKTTQEMNKIKPLIEKLNKKYKEDPQRKQQELFKLYREHNINPLGMLKGCGWMAIQIPIFIALYRLLYQSIDLRGADFLWVRDLSQPDMLFSLPFALPMIGSYFNLLPIITAGTQVLTSKFMQTPATDPQQEQMQKMMTTIMPIFILIFTYRFPSGLMLYWLVSNFWQVLQQLYVNKVIKKPQPPTPAAAS